MAREERSRNKRESETEKKTAPKFQAPKGFTAQSSDAVGYWTDDGESAILFVPTGVKLMDSGKKIGPEKPMIMLVGKLKSAGTPLATKDDEFEGQVGDTVAVFYKPGMGREIVNAYGVETWIAPAYDDDGERKTRDVNRPQPMKLYDVKFGKDLQTSGKRIPVIDDLRKESRDAKTPFDDASLAPVRRAPPKEAPPADDVDDEDIPF
ncbi:MAG TPA: hypothetical protein VNN80_03875 [Polyangiaceae bacterium]|nr:hypothetical protein [Polyangiaceae bacterium]HWP04474.1 hypothetical protein [Polyangiaceae bacterium]